VDRGRDNAVVRFAVGGANGRVSEDINITYQRMKSEWLPQSWTRTTYHSSGQVLFVCRLHATHCDAGSIINEDNFRVNVEPGMLVRDTTYKTEVSEGRSTFTKEMSFFRAGEGGELAEVTFVDGVERRKWPLPWWWLTGAIAILLFAVGLYLWRRLRTTG
jgi:hypothetical protein